MSDWLSLEWVRYAWGPVLTGGLLWLANVWKATNDARAASAGRMDARQDRLFTAQDERIADLEALAKSASENARYWEGIALAWFRKAHTLSHALLSARMGAAHVLEQHGKPVPETWGMPEDLPPLEGVRPVAKT